MEKTSEERFEEARKIKEANEEEQIRKQKKTLLIFFIIIGVMILAFLATWYLINTSKHFTYKGVDFYVDESTAKGMTLFKATIVGRVTASNYNFYFRNEPSQLEKIPIVGDLIFRKNIVFDSSANNFSCGGNGMLAISQFSNGISSIPGFKLSQRNESMKYIPQTDYMFLHFVKGNSTEIKRINSL